MLCLLLSLGRGSGSRNTENTGKYRNTGSRNTENFNTEIFNAIEYRKNSSTELQQYWNFRDYYWNFRDYYWKYRSSFFVKKNIKNLIFLRTLLFTVGIFWCFSVFFGIFRYFSVFFGIFGIFPKIFGITKHFRYY